MEQTRGILKGYFETGDKPTEQEYIDLIDSCLNKTDDSFITTIPDSSTTQKGIAEQATLAEVETGTDGSRFVTPEGAKRAAETHSLVKSVNGQTGDVIVSSNDDSGWIDAPLQGTITNVGGAFQTARYRKLNGVVYIEGRVQGGVDDSTNTIFQLPLGFRPTKRLTITVIKSGRIATKLDINANGNLRCAKFSSTWTSICGISFLVD